MQLSGSLVFVFLEAECPRRDPRDGEGRVCVLQPSSAARALGPPLPGPHAASQHSAEGPPPAASGLTRVVPWQALLDRQPSREAQLGEPTGAGAGPGGRERAWEGRGLGSRPGPLGQDPLPTRHPRQGLGAPGHAGRAEGSPHGRVGAGSCWSPRRPAREAWPAADVSEGEARNPGCARFAPSRARSQHTGMAAAASLPTPPSSRLYVVWWAAGLSRPAWTAQ